MVTMPVVLGAPEAQLIFTRLTAAATLLPADGSADDGPETRRPASLMRSCPAYRWTGCRCCRAAGPRSTSSCLPTRCSAWTTSRRISPATDRSPPRRPTARRRSVGHLAPAADRPGHRRTARHQRTPLPPPQRLRDFVSARDDVCAFPTCNQPGYRCEYEHTIRPLSRRLDLPLQRRTRLPPAQPMQTRHRLGIREESRRLLHLDHRHRTHLHQHPHHPMDRENQPAETTGPAAATHPRTGPRRRRRRLPATHRQMGTRDRTSRARTDDEGRLATAHQALARAEHQRQHQLARRADPDHPPF